jgi:membrane protease YdiL (CAAX protease family)
MQQIQEPQESQALEEVPAASPARPAPARAVLEIGLCSGIPTTLTVQGVFLWLGLDAHAILGSAKLIATFIFFESTLLLSLIFVFQRLRSATIKDLGLIPISFKRELALGLAIVPMLFLLNMLVSGVFQKFFPRFSSPRNPLLELIQTRADLILFMLLALWAGGIKEELQRAFILDRFKLQFSAPLLGLFLWSFAFGAGHALQGVDSAVGAGLYGLIFGAVYLWRRCIFGPVVAHSVYDITVLLGYWLLDPS